MVRACWVSLVVIAGCEFNPAAPITIDGTTEVVVDADPGGFSDAAGLQLPSFAAAAVISRKKAANVTLPLTIPSGSERFLIVSVQLGTNCFSSAPNVVSVRYNGVALAQLATISGTPCGLGGTRSDQWQLVDPATGTHDVVVTLSNEADTVHCGALAFTGVNQTTPVRATAKASGAGDSSSVTVASAVDDLVVNTVGQGNSIEAPGVGQTERFLHNVNSFNTLNNSAASTAPGASMVTMTWTFGMDDEFQTISSSLRP